MKRKVKICCRMLFRASVAVFAMIAIFFLTATVIIADDFVIYPAKGQSNDQMEKDKYECYQWAKNQSGFDPMKAPTATTTAPQQKGGVVKGAAVGALAGVAIGAIAGDAGKGAAIGAASGGIIGGARRHQSSKEQQNWANQEAQKYDQQRNAYNKAWGACMEGRGYTVK
ncbi:MAG: hypothetical protein JW902_03035 [Syntrophaceae bacterium]|nr:hypothetical protein [Syntrophaceae bacterium]